MKITKITPRGFCQGVVSAWMTAKKIKEENPNKKVYMIGWLVHNKSLIDSLHELGIETIDDTNTSRYDIVNSFKKNKNEIIIFSAHGTDERAIELAKNKSLIFFDTTCEYVKKTQEIIKDKIKDNYKIIFIGKSNHPETISILSIDKSIIFIENEEDINKITFNKNEKYFLTNQTTISIYDFYKIIKKLKIILPRIEIKNDICTATQERQEAIINMDNSVDLLIVVGDKKSNNSNKLRDLGEEKGIESYLINDEKDLNDKWFKNKKHVAITSGASTPTWITTKVIKTIEEKWG